MPTIKQHSVRSPPSRFEDGKHDRRIKYLYTSQVICTWHHRIHKALTIEISKLTLNDSNIYTNAHAVIEGWQSGMETETKVF